MSPEGEYFNTEEEKLPENPETDSETERAIEDEDIEENETGENGTEDGFESRSSDDPERPAARPNCELPDPTAKTLRACQGIHCPPEAPSGPGSSKPQR